MKRTLSLVALAALSGVAHGQGFNIDFGSAAFGFGSPAPAFGGAAGLPGTWNNVDADLLGTIYTTPPMMTVAGVASTVTLEFDSLGSGGFVPFEFNSTWTTGDDETLLDDCYYNNGASMITVHGLAAGNYTVFTYAMAPDDPTFQTGVDVTGSLDPLQAVGGDFSAGYMLGVTHAEHDVTVAPGGTIVINFSIVNQYDSINGMQIVPAGALGLGTNYCTPNANSTGVAAGMSASGSASVAANNVVLECSDMPLNAFGFFLTSLTPGSTPNPGGSQGVLCLSASIGRYVGAGQIKNSGALGAIDLAIDLSQTPTPTGLFAVMPGETRHFTCWFRDVSGGAATSNFADGLTIVFN